MNKIIIASLVCLIVCSSGFTQGIRTDAKKQLMQITTIESVLPGGLGRSKLIVTDADGTQKESDFNNLFSVAGINFKNIKENDAKLIQLLKSYTDMGWKIEQVIPLTLSQGENGSGGIFLTRYLLFRELEQK